MNKKERIAKYKAEMENINETLIKAPIEPYDLEAAHTLADIMLCELLNEIGYSAVVEAYDKIEPQW